MALSETNQPVIPEFFAYKLRELQRDAQASSVLGKAQPPKSPSFRSGQS